MDHHLFARRRILFDRVRRARDAAPKASPQRAKLDVAVLRSAQLLTTISNSILSSSPIHAGLHEDTPPLRKWRTRLSRELDILRQASDLLSYAILAKKKKLQTEFLDNARILSRFVRKQLPNSNTSSMSGKDQRIMNIVVVRRKVHRYETQIIEQIANLAAADAHHVITVTAQKKEKESTYNYGNTVHVQDAENTSAINNINAIKCDTLRYLTEIKTALSLLLILT